MEGCCCSQDDKQEWRWIHLLIPKVKSRPWALLPMLNNFGLDTILTQGVYSSRWSCSKWNIVFPKMLHFLECCFVKNCYSVLTHRASVLILASQLRTQQLLNKKTKMTWPEPLWQTSMSHLFFPQNTESGFISVLSTETESKPPLNVKS